MRDRVKTVGEGADDGLDEFARRIHILSRVHLFSGWDRDLLATVVMALKAVSLPAGSTICRRGDPGDDFYIIDSGTVVVTSEGGHELARLGPGEYFGEMALLGERRTATVRSITDVSLLSLSSAALPALCAEHPDLAQGLQEAATIRQAANEAQIDESRRNLGRLLEGATSIRVGRDPQCDLVLKSPSVSRVHAALTREGDVYRLEDLGSSNGTHVNGRRIQSVQLHDGDEVWFAGERYIFDRSKLERWAESSGVRIDLEGVSKTVRGGKRLLDDITLSILPGEFVAIVGGSGAGKSTLMDAMSGVRRATGGSIRYNHRDYYRDAELFTHALGYVPQDDIIHTALPVRETLRHAARLRLPRDTSGAELDHALDETLDALSLRGQADIPVSALSGGQRKRCSIGVELLTHPRVFFLDEPTSGLDPATDGQMMRLMRRLADDGSTVILTTHATRNVVLCDKVVILARGGHLAFVGTPLRALRYFGVDEFDEIYDRLEEAEPAEWARRFRTSGDYARVEGDRAAAAQEARDVAPVKKRLGVASAVSGLIRQVHQFSALLARNTALLTRQRSNMIPIALQPLAITLLLIALFKGGAFAPTTSNPTTAMQILLVLAYGLLFFGISFGIQEICKEFPIFARERMVRLGIGPYVLSKVALLAPILLLIAIFMTAILRITDHLPHDGISVYASMIVTLELTGLAGLTLGLLVSALVPTSEVATRLLPLLVLPQVLFSGGFLAVPSMNLPGKAISLIMALRWSFEALGNVVNLNGFFARTTSPIGHSLLLQYGDTFARTPSSTWVFMGVFAVCMLGATYLTLAWRTAGR